jgi:hypothetical protein
MHPNCRKRPTVPEVIPLVRALYRSREGGAGCCLHVVLDDNNIDDAAINFCIQYARDQQHPRCLELALLLRQMTRTQRDKLGNMPVYPRLPPVD